MSAQVPALPLEVDPLIAEAKQRARRRRLLVAAALLAVGAVVVGVLALVAGGSSGEVPWLPTRPQLGPAHPPLAPACRASQLRASLGFEGAGFGMFSGPLTVTNRSSASCALVGTPKVSFVGATSKWRFKRQRSSLVGPSYDPLAPPQSSLRALAPGRSAATYLTWSGWCGRGSSRDGGNPGRPPRAMILTLPGGGRIPMGSNLLHHQQTTPTCDPVGPSIIAATTFLPVVPPEPRSVLPFAARIVFAARTAQPGTWLSYTVVLTNRSPKPYSFGRTCPAYEQGFGFRPAAYILNCHAVGTIAPHAAVRFAMRIRLPAHPGRKTLAWNLGPHTRDGGVLDQQSLQLR